MEPEIECPAFSIYGCKHMGDAECLGPNRCITFQSYVTQVKILKALNGIIDRLDKEECVDAELGINCRPD